jgi:hypothetical protein
MNRVRSTVVISCARRCMVSVVGAMILGACALSAKSLPACEDATMTYQYPGDGSIGERYQSGLWWRINSENAPEAAAAPETSAAVPQEEAYPLDDCSTTEFLCVRTYHRVFAVPRGEIKPGTKYIVAGADTTVEGCLRSSDGECVSALFISDCRSADGSRRSRAPAGEIVGKDCRLVGWGQQVMFIFDRERGVIAYEPADWWKPGTDISRWDLSTLGVSAGLLALVESKGLLSCEVSSRD